MASNFKITVGKNENCLNLKLSGDFDGTSAYELINVIKKCSDDIPKIIIHTNDLKTVIFRDSTSMHLSPGESLYSAGLAR